MIKKFILVGTDLDGNLIQEQHVLDEPEMPSSINILNTIEAFDDKLLIQFAQYDIGEPLTQEVLDNIRNSMKSA